MTTAAPGAGDELAPLLDDARHGVAKITEVVNGTAAAINVVIDLLPPDLVALIHQKFDELMVHVNDALAEMNRVLANAGSPSTLRAAATSWASAVGEPVSGQASVTTLNTMVADDYWQGAAATAYKNTLPAQAAAFTAVKTTTDKISDILHDMATAITTFWLGVCTALVTLIAALIVAGAAAATGVGAPVALGLTAGELIAFGGLLTASIAALGAARLKALGDAGALTNAMTTDAAYPNGTWPVSTRRIDDASVHQDGHLDWKVIP